MRIVAHLGVLDEIELVGAAIDHLHRIGVDQLVVFDMGSTDGTLELLEQREGPALELVRLRNDTPWAEWQQRTVDCVRRTGADWVVFLDGDEFWLPRGGDLRPILAASNADVLTVDRFNVVLGPDGPCIPDRLDDLAGYADTLLYCRSTPDFRRYLDNHPEAAWIAGVPVPKVVGRVAAIESVTMGGHNVVLAGAAERAPVRARATGIVIAHVPVSTLSRFRRRLRNIHEFLSLSPDYLQGAQGWHWRRWAGIHRQDAVEQEYRRQVLDADAMRAFREDGAIRSAAELLAPQPLA